MIDVDLIHLFSGSQTIDKILISTGLYQFWSPLLLTDDARHSFSLTGHGSVGPTACILCSMGQKDMTENVTMLKIILVFY